MVAGLFHLDSAEMTALSVSFKFPSCLSITDFFKNEAAL